MWKNLSGLGENGLTPGTNVLGTGTAADAGTATSDCPCDCQEATVDETWYINEISTPDAIPFNLTEKKIDCTAPPSNGVYDPQCADIVAALQSTYPGVQGISGLGCGCGNPGCLSDGTDVVTPINPVTPPDLAPVTPPKKQIAGAWYLGGAALAILLGSMLFGKKHK